MPVLMNRLFSFYALGVTIFTKRRSNLAVYYAPLCKYGRAIHAASAAYSYPSRSLPDLVFSCIVFTTLQESILFTKIFYTFYLPIQNK